MTVQLLAPPRRGRRAPAGTRANTHAGTRAEQPLLARLRAGDERAFEQLVRAHAPRMLSTARRILHHEQDAQDAVQDALLAACRAIGRFQGQSALDTWLHRITVNACLMMLRARRRGRELPIGPLLPTFRADGSLEGARHEPALPLEAAERSELVHEAVARLAPPYRDVLVLRDLEQLSTRETAQMLGLTEAGVKSRLHRARQALRALLGPRVLAG